MPWTEFVGKERETHTHTHTRRTREEARLMNKSWLHTHTFKKRKLVFKRAESISVSSAVGKTAWWWSYISWWRSSKVERHERENRRSVPPHRPLPSCHLPSRSPWPLPSERLRSIERQRHIVPHRSPLFLSVFLSG